MQKDVEMELEDPITVESLDDTAEDEAVLSVYEIGYHFLPTLSEGELTTAVEDLNGLLSKNGAEMVGEQAPLRMPLAYTMTKRIAGKITGFDEAFFGWVAFEMPRGSIARVKEALDIHPSVLRYIIVKTTRDEVATVLAGDTTQLPTIPASGTIEKPKRETEEGGEVSEKALDQALETIEAEDTKTSE